MQVTGDSRSVRAPQSRRRLTAGGPVKTAGQAPRTGKVLKIRRKRAADAPALRMPLSTTRAALLDEGGTTDHQFRQLLLDFSTLGASLEIARAHLASLLGLSSPQYNIAMILANHQHAGGIRVSDVARRLHVSTAFITAEANRLEQAGLIEKRPNPADGRGILLRLSSAGARLVERVGPERQRVNDQLFAHLSSRGFQELSKTLSALLDDFSSTLSQLKQAG